jgi:hypothetical protein
MKRQSADADRTGQSLRKLMSCADNQRSLTRNTNATARSAHLDSIEQGAADAGERVTLGVGE